MRPSPFHPDLRRVAAVLPRGGRGPTLLRVGRALEAVAARRRPPPGVEVVSTGAAAVRVHRPGRGDGPFAGLLWIHGGGFLIGTPAQDDARCRRIARELGVVVAAVAYRRAPEHPFPTPLHDCDEALRWLARQADVDPSRIAIGGASAGGGLAAALALLARDRGEVRPVLQLLSYPMLDDRTAARDERDDRRFRLWNHRINRFAWRAYLGRDPGSPDVDGLAAPGRHDDLAGLPPAWIGVGTLDLFEDEDRAYARRLRDAGVPCELHVVDGAFHGFDAVRPKAGVSADYRAAQLRALATHLREGTPR